MLQEKTRHLVAIQNYVASIGILNTEISEDYNGQKTWTDWGFI